jgi:hypothetical protein
MKKHLIVSLTLAMIPVFAHAAENAIPAGCIRLEDEIKFTGKDVYLSPLGHLTAGKLSVSHLSSMDDKAADVIRNDDIPDLKDDDTTLAKGEVTLGTSPLPGSGPLADLVNDPVNPRSTLQLKVRQKDENTADIVGSIKLKPAQISLIRMKAMNLAKLDAPISVCGIGMQLYVSSKKSKIDTGTVILYINNGSDKPIAIQALNQNRGDKAIHSSSDQDGAQLAQDQTSQEPVGQSSAL